MHETMRAALRDAMKARDKVAVTALRSVLAALDNATAVNATLPAVEHEHIAGSAGGLGAGEVARAELTAAQTRAVLAREIEERQAAALDYDRAGQAETAARLRAEADVLAAF
jgi:uncharacterized protein YqeY